MPVMNELQERRNESLLHHAVDGLERAAAALASPSADNMTLALEALSGSQRYLAQIAGNSRQFPSSGSLEESLLIRLGHSRVFLMQLLSQIGVAMECGRESGTIPGTDTAIQFDLEV